LAQGALQGGWAGGGVHRVPGGLHFCRRPLRHAPAAMRRVNIKSTADGFQDWSLDIDLERGATVAELKEVLAAPPHSLPVESSTKVLWKTSNGVHMALLNEEKARANVVLLDVAPTTRVLRFPEGFLWGTATASYQIEGATDQDGRTPSIWDIFSQTPGNVHCDDTGEVACEHYTRFRADVKLMKELGLPAYRFSISWSRLLPAGTGNVNAMAVDFYGALIDELIANNITPIATIYHWDLPQCLEDKYGGWLGREVVEDFEHYADACFRSFGDRVKYWITLNEPWCACVLGYGSGEHAPGHKSASSTEPYLAAHHMILAHAKAVRRYHSNFRAKQAGKIGITLNMDFKEPLTLSPGDIAAQGRAMDWQLGWFADPIYRGDYPESMRRRCRSRLPTFTQAEKDLVKGTSDFFGLNHYSTDYVAAPADWAPLPANSEPRPSKSYFEDQEVDQRSDPNWKKTDMGWDIVPWGLGRMCEWIQREYSPPGGIIVTENGCAVREDTLDMAMNDTKRVEYFQGYLTQLQRAIEGGADVRGYFAWSFMDNFEWAFGYAKRFGIVYVDRPTQARTPKASARMFSEIVRENALRVPSRVALASAFKPHPLRSEGTKADGEPKPFGGSSSEKKKGKRKPGGQSPKQSSGRVDGMGDTITAVDAKKMLQELAVEYEGDACQTALAAIYKQYAADGDDMVMVKARRETCAPIQHAILPKYGFCPTPAGILRATVTLRHDALLAADDEVQSLSRHVQYLVNEFPALGLEGVIANSKPPPPNSKAAAVRDAEAKLRESRAQARQEATLREANLGTEKVCGECHKQKKHGKHGDGIWYCSDCWSTWGK